MKLTLVSSNVGDLRSGQSRLLLNLCAGLRAVRTNIQVVCLFITEEAKLTLEEQNIHVVCSQAGLPSRMSKAKLLTRFNNYGKKLAQLTLRAESSEWYVVVSDDAVGFSDHLSQAETAYWCQGDLALLFLSESFYHSLPLTKRFMSKDMASIILRNNWRIRRYNQRLANSEFTRLLMQFIYCTPFENSLYSPVDRVVFRPTTNNPSGDYALALARNDDEQHLDLLEKIASRLPLKVVGNAHVRGAQRIESVDDQSLADLYSNAKMLIFPAVAEFFGAPVAEAQACGTPVLAFDSGGPAELIEHSVNGWLVRDFASFVHAADDIYHGDYDPQMRKNARVRTEVFDKFRISREFLDILSAASAQHLRQEAL